MPLPRSVRYRERAVTGALHSAVGVSTIGGSVAGRREGVARTAARDALPADLLESTCDGYGLAVRTRPVAIATILAAAAFIAAGCAAGEGSESSAAAPTTALPPWNYPPAEYRSEIAIPLDEATADAARFAMQYRIDRPRALDDRDGATSILSRVSPEEALPDWYHPTGTPNPATGGELYKTVGAKVIDDQGTIEFTLCEYFTPGLSLLPRPRYRRPVRRQQPPALHAVESSRPLHHRERSGRQDNHRTPVARRRARKATPHAIRARPEGSSVPAVHARTVRPDHTHAAVSVGPTVTPARRARSSRRSPRRRPPAAADRAALRRRR